MELVRLKTTWRLTIGEHSMYLTKEDLASLYGRLGAELMDVLPVGDGGEALLAKKVVSPAVSAYYRATRERSMERRSRREAVLGAADQTEALPWTGTSGLKSMDVGETRVFMIDEDKLDKLRTEVSKGVCYARKGWGWKVELYHVKNSNTWAVVRKS